MNKLNTVKILDTNVTTDSENKILEYIITGLKTNGRKLKIFTPNSEIAVFASKHPSFKSILNSADVSLPDGYWFEKGGQFLGKRLQGRIAGVDFMQKLCRTCAKEGLPIGLFGGQDNVAEKAAECLVDLYPGIDIIFIGEKWERRGFERAEELQPANYDLEESKNKDLRTKKTKSKDPNTQSFIKSTVESNLTKSGGVLFVALGSPKQEEWIYENIDKVPFQAAMGVGGAFDYISGKVTRAPYFLQAAGFEWLYRLIKQPWRFKRQLSLLEFVVKILKERVSPTSRN